MRYRLILILALSTLLVLKSHGQQQPYGGTPWPIPGKIEAEDYDTGEEVEAYHDTDKVNSGGKYRSDGVDIEACGEGGYDVGWIEPREWLEYTVNIAESGDYVIRVRTASGTPEGGTFHMEFTRKNVSGTRTAPGTGGGQNYTWVNIPRVHLDAGERVMRLFAESGGFNLNYFTIVRVYDTQSPTASLISPNEGEEFVTGQTVILKAEASDADGTVQYVEFFAGGVKIGEDADAPFELRWTPLVEGRYSLYAVATDNMGAATVSDSVEVRVLAPELPDGPDFSVPHGFYDSAFDLTVSWDSAGSSIRYTLDGSDPRASATAAEKTSPAKIPIDPAAATDPGRTPAVVVRAYALVNGMPATNVGIKTYIFIDNVKTQKYPGGGWPKGTVNSETLDYDMDPDVVNNVRYRNLMKAALLDIPSFCINTDLKNLFDPHTGIYVNPTQRGREWEKPASIELIDPKRKEKGFQINAGLRIRGGYSRIGSQPKHAFRFYFRKEYGKGKLEYPLFQDEGVSSFDNVDLRTAQNYSWSYFGSHVGIFIRDVFSRDCQRVMGQPYTRSRAYHLFLNGMYWGLYQTEERPEASFAESYFGSDKANYDVVKVDLESGNNVEATDGTLTAYDKLWSYSMSGFKTNAAYFKVLGKNADGSVNWSYPALVNPENLIDYLLIIYYTGNFDSPVSAFGGNGACNNFFCIYDRLGRTGFLDIIHDAEHTLMDPRYSENSDYGLDRTGPYPCGDRKGQFNPQWLHQKLSENEEYRVLFSDRIYKHFYNQGAMTLDSIQGRFKARADEISLAVIAESARWGDSKTHPARTKDDDWLPSVKWVQDNFFPKRFNVVLGQLKNDNLYPSISPPVFRNGSQDIPDDALTLSPGSSIRLVNPNSGGAGSIYYTLDGTDPRLIGGSVSAMAQDGGDDKELTISSNTVLKARVKDGSVWSAVHEILLNTGQALTGLRITEIQYNPLGNGIISGSEFEFIELKNVGMYSLPLAGARFVNGIDYRFPDDAMVTAGGFVVLASNSGMFQKRYGFGPFGEYDGQLDNRGERLVLTDVSGDTLVSVRYNDKSPWPEEADSAGYSLAARNAGGNGNPDSSDYWRASHTVNGSPGADDLSSGIEEGGVRIPKSFTLEQNYPNPFNPSTEIRFTVPRSSFLRLAVYDILGREVSRLAEGHFQAGIYSVTWNASSCPAGIYMSRLEAEGIRLTRKLTLLK